MKGIDFMNNRNSGSSNNKDKEDKIVIHNSVNNSGNSNVNINVGKHNG